MFTKGNFSCNVASVLKMGKEAFIKAHKGRYDGDINQLWAEIEAQGAPDKKKSK